ncbi:MAG: hypothetical protein OXK73_09245 [Rhodospirillaceae bacterium]|nr:hypothetical protein [Rhodospirillaceae bacterium]
MTLLPARCLQTLDHGAVHGVLRLRHGRAMKRKRNRRRGATRRRGAKTETGGGSAGKPSQVAVRGAGAAVEIEDGATVDAIATSVRAGGIPRASQRGDGESSHSAGGDGDASGAAGDSQSSSAGDALFAARIRGLIDMQREARALTAAWAESREPGAGERSARFAIEGVRSMVQHKMAELSGRTEPASLDELECLSRALQRIEVADRYCSERERAAAEAESTVHPAERKPPLSTEELRAKLYPAIMEQFNIKRLGTQPWEPWPDDPPPAEPHADAPLPETVDDHAAWDESEAQSEAEAWTAHGSEEAREERGPVETQEARDEERVHREHDKGNPRRARDEVRPRMPLASERLRNAGGLGSTWAALSDFY